MSRLVLRTEVDKDRTKKMTELDIQVKRTTLVHSEAAMVEIHVKLLSDKKVCRSQQHGTKQCQTKLYEYWQQ